MNYFWNTITHFSFKTGKFLMLTLFTTGMVLLLCLGKSTAQNAPEIGFEFEGSPQLNQVTIYTLQYTGECPGRAYGTKEARFTSSDIPPAPERRVVVRNVSRGVSSDPYPYTDREYNRGKVSEGTAMAFGTRHSNDYFNVLEGENKFEYDIKEKDQVIATGSFTAQINSRADREQRYASCERQSYCSKKDVPLKDCPDVRTRQVCRCPGGTTFYR